MTQLIEKSEQRRRRTLRAATPLAALLMAALLVWQGSNAAFSATTDNTANAWETGYLELANNGGETTFELSTDGLFEETNLSPGDTGAKCITVESTGSLDGVLRIYTANMSGTDLGDVITVDIDAVEGAANTNIGSDCSGYAGGDTGALFSGSLTDIADDYVAAAGTSVNLDGGTERIVYRIGWTVEDADNTLMDETTQADLVWEVR